MVHVGFGWHQTGGEVKEQEDDKFKKEEMENELLPPFAATSVESSVFWSLI